MSITAQEALMRILERRELTVEQMTELMNQILRGEVSATLISALLIGLRMKKETVGEIVAGAKVLRDLATKVHTPPYKNFVDIVGTGGDGTNSFNISTAAMFVAAAAGAQVAKHGNRSVSSKSGSADVLEALGAIIELNAEQVEQCLERTGIGFMLAPSYHPTVKAVAPVRKELGVRTLFNILGPLSNPAGAPHILMGVFDSDMVGTITEALRKLGAQNALVVCGKDGMDEISLACPTIIGELRRGTIREYEIRPEEFGLDVRATNELRVATVNESKTLVLNALNGAPSSARDIVALNAGAALYVADTAASIRAGVELAQEAIASGAARAKLEQFVTTTQAIAKRTLRWKPSFGIS